MSLVRPYLQLLCQSLGTERLLWISDLDELEECFRTRTSFPDSFNFLDLGCGIGSVFFAIKSVYPWAQCTGVDDSKFLLELALKMDPQLSLNCMDLLDDRVIDYIKKADLIYCYQPIMEKNKMLSLIDLISNNYKNSFIFKGSFIPNINHSRVITFKDYSMFTKQDF